jgi:hypothetical protein
MTSSSIASLAPRLLRRMVLATCGCAARHWKVDASRSFGGVVVRAELRSR